MKKISPKFVALALTSLLSSSTVSCGQTEIEQTFAPVEANTSIEYEINALSDDEIQDMVVTPEVEEEVVIEEVETPEIEEEKEETYKIEMVDTIVATKDTNILDADGNLIGTLPEGRSIKINANTEDGHYEVTYYNDIAYIDANHVIESIEAEIVGKIQKVLYAKKDTILVVPEYLSTTGEELEVKIDALECFEVYEELEDFYLVQTIDYVGYIAKENLEELTGTFVVVDISSQELRLYKDNELIFRCPVVTGTPTKDRHTDEGLWKVHTIRHNYALQDAKKTYYSPVDIMIKFHENEGLHDAEYHSCDFWQKQGRDPHGWRAINEFGGKTYLTNGSHGCVNMKHDDVFFVADYVEIGTPVLVKP